MYKRFIQAVFFGNYFCGFCAVALSIEASLQQRYPLNGIAWYVLVFSMVVLYYTYAYIRESTAYYRNERTSWYKNNRRAIKVNMVVFAATAGVCVLYILLHNAQNIPALKAWQWVIAGVFPSVALLYYGLPYKDLELYNLRNAGWLKPFLIGFVWAGCITIYPVLFYQLETGHEYILTNLGILLFLKNMMFISILGIMFDIKDYATDYNQQLKTFVVQAGLRKTIFYIIIPLGMLGFLSFLAFAFISHFALVRIGFNCIPFILLLVVAYSMHRRKTIMYYLVVIDGLLLVKAICGIMGMLLIN